MFQPLPAFSILNIVDISWLDSDYCCNLRSCEAKRTQTPGFMDLLLGHFARSMRLASRPSAVAIPIIVFLFCCPAKIVSCVVEAIAVVVRDLVAWWPRPMKGLTNQNVDVAMSGSTEWNAQITALRPAGHRPQNFAAQSFFQSVLIDNDPVARSYLAETARLVSRKFSNWSPFWHHWG